MSKKQKKDTSILLIEIEKEEKEKFKMICIEKNMTMKDVLGQYIKHLNDKYWSQEMKRLKSWIDVV